MLRIIFLIFFSGSISAQLVIDGSITEAKSGLPIPYASIGISGKHYGTLSNENGNFKLKIPYVTEKDTLKISAIGFETLFFTKNQILSIHSKIISLQPISTDLPEVKITAKSVKKKTLGTKNYSERNCTAFISEENNWLGSQAAIKAGNKNGRIVYIENFSFFIVKNLYTDSIRFRLMFYSVSPKGYPAKTFLKKPIIFKTNVKQGEVTINLKEYFITTDEDFFISLECLEENMDETKFCFAGSVNVPSYAKTSTFNYWKYVKGGGADLNVTVSYLNN